MTDAPFDPGLQAERTLLAWRRTCLSLGLASAVVVRFTADEVGLVGVLLGAIGVVLAVAAYVAAAERYRRVHSSLTGTASTPPRYPAPEVGFAVLAGDGRALALLASTVFVLGIACGTYLVADSLVFSRPGG